MRTLTKPDTMRAGATAIVMLLTTGQAAAQLRSLPAPPPPATMAIPRPNPELVGPPVVPVPESAEPRQSERVCIEKEMCVDVPSSPKPPPSASAPR